MKRMAVVAFAAVIGGCSKSSTGPGVACTAIAAAGINLIVVDSVTGNPDIFPGLWARARDGAYVDSSALAFVDPSSGAVRMALAYERAGTYTVTVHVADYLDWVKSGVVVGHDECHVIPVQLTARLARP